MPIFEYLCSDCGTRFEKLVRNSDNGSVHCPSCGESHLERQLSVFSAHGNTRETAPTPGACPSGMCQNPGMCQRNWN